MMDPGIPEVEVQDSLRPRPYQSELEEIAFKRNTIIHLPTGSGKTFIAISLINRLSHSLKKPWGKGGKRCFFLVNTIPLVKQQKEVIQKLTNIDKFGVAGYSGEDGVDYWDKSKWDAELTKHQVIVMTSQILADMLTHAYLRIEDINLIIFDECHHAVVDHPMRVVMKHFENCPPELHPRVVGLTATLLNANVSSGNVAYSLRVLETTFHATIATVNSLGDVIDYSTKPNELIYYFKKWQLNDAAREATALLMNLTEIVMSVNLPRVIGTPNVRLEEQQQNITSDPNKIVKEVKNMIVSMKTLIEELGTYGGSLAILAYLTLLDRLKRKAMSTEEERLYKLTSSHCLAARMILLKSMKMFDGFEKIVNFSSPRVLLLLAILKEYNPDVYNSPGVVLKVNTNRKPLSAIIFTKQRFSAKVLYTLLSEVRKANPKDYGFLHHDFIVGFNINPYKNTREQYFVKRSSETALHKFRREELNCLIATNVIEEGVDIPQCLLVLRYDPPLEYRSYIQSKGRARSSESAYVLLIDEDNAVKFNKQYKSFQETEKYIHRLLVGKTECRGAPTLEDIQEDLYDDDDIPPYITANGTRLLPASAISLLNRYCTTLPRDQFTTLAPMWIQEIVDINGTELRLIKIYMPIACPIKEPIAGIPMANLKSARRSAALNVCIKLHEAGELDHYTLLPKPYGIVDFDETNLKGCFPNWPPENAEPDFHNTGTKKCVRRHKKVFPKCLKGFGNTIEPKTYYLHIIKIDPAFEEPKDSREKALYFLLKRNEGYGLLTLNALPKLCDFPLFLTAGEVHTSLLMNYAVVQLNSTMFGLIKRFHYLIFNGVLEVAKKFTVFDGTENCLYVVPVTNENGYDIDWATMQTYTYIPPAFEPTYEERRRIHVTKEDYLHQVVTPWYRGAILFPDRYIVSNVLEYKTPYSNFDEDGDGSTFADYYSTKYKLEILGSKDQPLLEVRSITSRMNCLMPRANTIKAFSEKQRRILSHIHGDDKPKGFPEYFVPEFCIKYEFPGVLWYKAIMLPSICHRVLSLLVAHEFRAEIAKGIKCGVPFIKPQENWKPIVVDMDAVISAMLSQIEEPSPVCKIDRINDPIDQSAPRPPVRDSVKESLAQLQKKKIDEGYPWDESQEPIDIERNLTTVTLMDIECYDKFVSALMPTERPGLNKPPRAAAKTNAAAIMPPPPKYVDKIKLLSKQPSVRGPELCDVLAALTTAKARDSFNMERVETLGDSFLKFAASLYLFHKFPTYDEGRLTTIKCRMIGNRNLFYAGVNKNLPGRMKVETFIPRSDFLVPGFFAPKEIENFINDKGIRPTFLHSMTFDESEALSGELSDQSLASLYQRCMETDLEEEPPDGAQTTMQCYIRAQAVSDKSIADCVEALVGTYLLDGGVKAAGRVLEWFNILPKNGEKFENVLKKRVPTALSENITTLEEIDRVLNHKRENVEEILQYKFKDPSLLLEALSHTSYIRNRITRNYGRLEFLGDAILDFLITSYIFETCPKLKPGELTDLRSALVNNVTFASYVVRLSLQKYMCYLMTPVLSKAIMSFVSHQESRNFVIEEDVLYLVDEEDCHIADYVEVPKIISDIFESLAGAIYLDTGGDLEAVWAVFYRIMHNEIAAFSRKIPQQPVRVLHENMYACAKFGDPISLTTVPKVSVPVTFTKEGKQEKVYGFGRNKSQAKRAAAKMALKILM